MSGTCCCCWPMQRTDIMHTIASKSEIMMQMIHFPTHSAVRYEKRQRIYIELFVVVCVLVAERCSCNTVHMQWFELRLRQFVGAATLRLVNWILWARIRWSSFNWWSAQLYMDWGSVGAPNWISTRWTPSYEADLGVGGPLKSLTADTNNGCLVLVNFCATPSVVSLSKRCQFLHGELTFISNHSDFPLRQVIIKFPVKTLVRVILLIAEGLVSRGSGSKGWCSCLMHSRMKTYYQLHVLIKAPAQRLHARVKSNQVSQTRLHTYTHQAL